MSPGQASFFIPMFVFCIYFASYYFNIKMAKKRVSIWRRGSTYMFLRSNGLAGIKTRTDFVWMQKLGYDEREAIILAEYQTRANLCAFGGFVIFGSIAVNLVRH
jgi:hypothetical protein